MSHEFCPGYPAPFAALVADYPDAAVYPTDSFRVEWGPIFHRGRLDGTARVLVIGQDPATEEDITRRILVGTAGQRVQGLLARLGIIRSYVMINTFLYSVYGSAGAGHLTDPDIVSYRHAWIDTLTAHNDLNAVITFGTLAASAYTAWAATPNGTAADLNHAALLHPTYPESAAASGQQSESSAFRALLANWNAAMPGLGSAITHPDQPAPLTRYGYTFKRTDYTPIPEADLPPGIPDWMRSTEPWALRTGRTSSDKRATITAAVPTDLRTW
jgi:hypothetical protein